MKSYLVMIVLIFLPFKIFAQTYSEVNGYVSDESIPTIDGLPIIRTIEGGTLLKVSYSEDCTYEMQGAFNYACRILEEALPSSLPITISVGLGTFRGADNKQLSKVDVLQEEAFGRDNLAEMVLMTRIKRVLLKEREVESDVTYLDSIPSWEFLSSIETPDIRITYNKSYLNEFSFSLDENSVGEDFYDFVSLALRDLVRGFGYYSTILKNPNEDALWLRTAYANPFEKAILNAIGSDDLNEQFSIATQGELRLSSSLILYAPTTWQNGISLNYFIPTENRLSQILSTEFGKGTIRRNVTELNIGQLLNWKWDLIVGSSTPSLTSDGSNNVKVPFNGSISISQNTTYNLENTDTSNNSDIRKIVSRTPSVRNAAGDDYEHIVAYCDSLHPFWHNQGGHGGEGITVSLLRKNGLWDVVYDANGFLTPIALNMSDWVLNFSAEEYARTCDGYLRGRVTTSTRKGRTYSYKSTYFVIDYLPQKIELELAPEVSTNRSLAASASLETHDIRINFKNLEGCDRLVIQKLEEGQRIASKYNVTDFKNGYFETSVKKNKWTKFTAVGYNDNGSTKSDELIIPAISATISSQQDNLNISISNKTIKVTTNLNDDTRQVKYSILSPQISADYPAQQGIINIGDNIDIASLSPGLYIVVCTTETASETQKFLVH